VHAFFVRWNERGLPQGLVDRLRGRLRTAWGPAELPTADSIYSQSVKAADTVGAQGSGYDAGKRINRHKRHVVVDSLDLLLTVIVTAVSVQDREGAFRLLAVLREWFSTITLVWADGGYAGRLVSWACQVLALTPPSAMTTPRDSSCCPAGGSWNGPSAGCCVIAAWSATTNDDPSITKRWCCRPPSRS
jgi:hypothetical protein